MLGKIGRFIDDHPIWSFITYLVIYKLVGWLAFESLSTSGCYAQRYGRRDSLFVSCDWSAFPPLDFLLNVFFGMGPLIGPVITYILLFVCYRLLIEVTGLAGAVDEVEQLKSTNKAAPKGWGADKFPSTAQKQGFAAPKTKLKKLQKAIRKIQSNEKAKPVTPYGSLEKHKEILISSGASEEYANAHVSKYRDP